MSEKLTDEQLAEIEARAEAARQEVFRICRRRGQGWTMSIPVRKTDSDRLFCDLANDADRLCDHIRAQDARIDALETALRPFQAVADECDAQNAPDDRLIWDTTGKVGDWLTVRHFRTARAALDETATKGQNDDDQA